MIGLSIIVDDSFHEGLLAAELLEAFFALLAKIHHQSLRCLQLLYELPVLLGLQLHESLLKPIENTVDHLQKVVFCSSQTVPLLSNLS